MLIERQNLPWERGPATGLFLALTRGEQSLRIYVRKVKLKPSDGAMTPGETRTPGGCARSELSRACGIIISIMKFDDIVHFADPFGVRSLHCRLWRGESNRGIDLHARIVPGSVLFIRGRVYYMEKSVKNKTFCAVSFIEENYDSIINRTRPTQGAHTLF